MADIGERLIMAGLDLGQNAVLYGISFLFVLTFVVFFHELGHFLAARWCGVTVEAFSIGFGRPLLSWKDRKGTLWKIGWLPLGGYVKFLGDEGAASTPNRAKLEDLRTQSPREIAGAFHFKPLWQRAIVVAAGPIANFLLAIVIFAGIFMIVGEERVPPVVHEVIAGTPAEKAGFQVGDRIVSLGGRSIEIFSDIQETVSVSAGQTVAVEVLRDGKILALSVVPETKILRDRFGNEHRIGRIGLSAVNDPNVIEHHRYNPVAAVARATEKVGFIISQTLSFLKNLIIGQADVTQLSGPVGIAKLSGEMAQVSLAALFYLVGALSVSVGFINLIPIPMLDGGHLLYYAYEGVRGRPLGERAQEFGFRLGLVLVISLMVFATWNDIVKLRPHGVSQTDDTR